MEKKESPSEAGRSPQKNGFQGNHSRFHGILPPKEDPEEEEEEFYEASAEFMLLEEEEETPMPSSSSSSSSASTLSMTPSTLSLLLSPRGDKKGGPSAPQIPRKLERRIRDLAEDLAELMTKKPLEPWLQKIPQGVPELSMLLARVLERVAPPGGKRAHEVGEEEEEEEEEGGKRGRRKPEIQVEMAQTVATILLRKFVQDLLVRHSEDRALFLLNLIDLWGTTPFGKLLEIYKEELSPAKSSKPTREKELTTSLDFLKRQTSVHFIEHRLEESFLPDHLKEQRQLVSCAIDTVSMEISTLIWAESMMLNSADILRLVGNANDFLQENYTPHETLPLRLSYEGVADLLNQIKGSLSSLLSPFLGAAAQFTFRLNIAKFLRGFFDKINDSVKLYNKFLKKRYWLLPSDGEAIDDQLDVFLWSELQRSHELHSSLALTSDPQEMKKERAYVASLLQKFHYNLFPQELLFRYLEETLPKETVDKIKSLVDRVELFGDAVLLGIAAEKVVEAINVASHPNTINSNLIEFMKRKHPDIYLAEISHMKSKSLREIAETFLLKILERSMDQPDEEWSWKNFINVPINWALGAQSLASGAAMEFFGVLQRQIFVKNIIYKTLDFIALEMEAGAYRSLHIAELLKSEHKDDVIERCFDHWKKDRFGNIFDAHQTRNASEAESDDSEESLSSVLTFIKGRFAMDLTKNLVDLLTFRQRQSWLSRSAWSAATANSLVQMGSSIYGVADLIGDVLISGLKKSAENLGTTEELLLAGLGTVITFLKSESRQVVGVREALESLFEQEDSHGAVEHHISVITSSKSGREGLDYITRNIQDKVTKSNFRILVQEAVCSDSTPEFAQFGRPRFVQLLWARVTKMIEMHQGKQRLFQRFPHPSGST